LLPQKRRRRRRRRRRILLHLLELWIRLDFQDLNLVGLVKMKKKKLLDLNLMWLGKMKKKEKNLCWVQQLLQQELELEKKKKLQ
jgi:hypothetical protein